MQGLDRFRCIGPNRVTYRDDTQDFAFAVVVRAMTNDDDRLLQAIRNGSQDTINDAGEQIVRRQLNIAPTLTIRPGLPVRVIVTRDLVLEPYGGS